MEIITGKQESMTHEANHVNLAQQTHYMRERILLEQSLMEEPNDTVFNHGFNGRVQNAMIFCWCTPRLAGVVLTASPP